MEHYEVKICKSDECIDDAKKIISSVFIYELTNNEKNTDSLEMYFIAYADDDQAGAATIKITGEIAELTAIAVLPLFQQQGVGRDLLKAVFQSLPKKVVKMELSSPSDSRAFFYSLGFTEEDAPFLVRERAYQKMVIQLESK